ncbi:MAG: NTP transferase domain-containing protein [Ardenticatenaceae bacterium]|nr:NTP transferase domain-containing protein [Ardenticatenaceae bacterium]
MKIIIPLAGYGTRMRPHTWSRAKPLLHVAGNTIIGHLLNLMSDVTEAPGNEVIFVVGYKGDEIEAWLRENYPHLTMHFVVQEEALGQAHAIWVARHHIDDDEDVLIAFGDGIVDAHYNAIPDASVDGVLLVQEMEDPRTFGVVVTDEAGFVTDFIEKPAGFEHRNVIAGIYWFRNGRSLRTALQTVIQDGHQTKGEYYLVDAYKVMMEQGARFKAQPTIIWLDAGKPDFMLEANKRLLGFGYGVTEDIIDLSYAMDFTALPPVFLHETAVIDASVLGPYVSIGANAVIKNSIIRNSIIDAGAHIENAIIEDSLIGENTRIVGQSVKLFIGDNSIIELHHS